MNERLTRSLFTASQVRAFDRRAIDEFGLPGLTLMRRAGRVCFEQLRETWPQACSLVIVCGGGNNGGDGFVIAELARRAGLHVTVFAASSLDRLSDDASSALADMRVAGVEVLDYDGRPMPSCDLIVDAMLGTGLERNLEGRYAQAVQAINASPAPVLAVDIPTGLHADTGSELGCAVIAELTCSFIGLKIGLFTGRGSHVAGRVAFDDLGVPDAVFDNVRPAALLIDPERALSVLAPRARDAHKGHFGHALVIGGARGYGGAAMLAAQACLRAGAGLVSVATHESYTSAFAARCAEAMFAPAVTAADVAPLIERATAIAIGPGLGKDTWAGGLLDAVLAARKPTVFDADALNLLATRGPAALPADSIVTPHPGEAARLLGCSTAEIQADRVDAAVTIATRFETCVVLKGAGTVIAQADGSTPPAIANVGNPGLATGGSGDTLTGIALAMLAQRAALGLHVVDAARLAVCAHGAAADIAARQGERGMLGTDVTDALRAVMNPAAPLR